MLSLAPFEWLFCDVEEPLEEIRHMAVGKMGEEEEEELETVIQSNIWGLASAPMGFHEKSWIFFIFEQLTRSPVLLAPVSRLALCFITHFLSPFASMSSHPPTWKGKGQIPGC